MQSNYIINRTPYLDYQLIKAVLRTSYSGAYNDYQTHDPIKRYAGQLTYAHIIRQAWPSLDRMKTNKGYAPSDLLTKRGKLVLLKNYIKKRLYDKQGTPTDPNAVREAFIYNHEQYAQWPVDKSFYNAKLIKDELVNLKRASDRATLMNVLSASKYLAMESRSV